MSAVTNSTHVELDEIEKKARASLKAKEITKAQAKEIFAELKVARNRANAETAAVLKCLPTEVNHIVGGINALKAPEEIEADAAAWAKTVQERQALEAKNAQKACAKCPGFCCLAFGMACTKAEMRTKLREMRAELQMRLERRERRITLGMLYYGEITVDADHERRMQFLHMELKQVKQIHDMVIPLKTTRRLRHDKFRSRSTRFYTCKNFLVAERRCGIYETRPPMCQSFLCETAAQGKVPPVETMFAHPSNTPENAGKLQIKWKPLEIPEKPKRKKKWKPSQSVSPEPSECVPCISSALSPDETKLPESVKPLCLRGSVKARLPRRASNNSRTSQP
jgi:Fe-S-cluster containining protein